MAAGLGTRLRPLTYEIPKPLVPVANRPIMEHILLLLRRHGFGPVIANLHWFPDTIRDRFGDGSGLGIDLTYSYEEELLGTAGGVRNVAEFFGDEPFLVMAADALTDIDLAALRAAHEANDGIATLAVKRVSDVSEFGVVITDSDGRDPGLPGEARPGRGALRPGELHDLRPRPGDLRLLPRPSPWSTSPSTCSRPCSKTTSPSTSTRSTPTGTTSARCRSTCGATWTPSRAWWRSSWPASCSSPRAPTRRWSEAIRASAAAVLAAEGCEIDPGARLDGPLVIGAGCTVGAGARVKESVLLPGAEVAAGRARGRRRPDRAGR